MVKPDVETLDAFDETKEVYFYFSVVGRVVCFLHFMHLILLKSALLMDIWCKGAVCPCTGGVL